MKGRYAGCHMTTYGYILPGASRIARWASRTGSLTKQAKQRLKVIDWYQTHCQNKSLASRHFGIGRNTLKHWLKRFKQQGLIGLNDKSRRPKKLRQPTLAWQIIEAVVKTRLDNPTWSKYKIKAYLKTERKLQASASSVGRILKRKGLINPKASRKRQKAALNPKARYPRNLVIKRPGDLVQMDTKFLRSTASTKLYQFTAIDVLTKLRVLHIATTASSRQAERFLKLCLKEFPLTIRAVQTDNGSEFLKCFDKACQKLNIQHYFTEPHSPKQNSYVERSIRTDKYEFYQQGKMRSSQEQLLPLVKQWQNHYNTKRPHQALNYLTPLAYYEQFKNNKGRVPTKDFIPLQT